MFLIFVSGKIVITGAKTETDLSKALTKMYPVLVEFRKAHVASMPGLPASTATVPPAHTNSAGAASAGPGVQGATTDSHREMGRSLVRLVVDKENHNEAPPWTRLFTTDERLFAARVDCFGPSVGLIRNKGKVPQEICCGYYQRVNDPPAT